MAYQPNQTGEKKANQPNQPKKALHDNLKAKTQQRFVKISPATAQWQYAVKKKKAVNRQNQQCSLCHKMGHTYRYCWQRIKCYNCGRSGHKLANCLFKTWSPRSYQDTQIRNNKWRLKWQQKEKQTLGLPKGKSQETIPDHPNPTISKSLQPHTRLRNCAPLPPNQSLSLDMRSPNKPQHTTPLPTIQLCTSHRNNSPLRLTSYNSNHHTIAMADQNSGSDMGRFFSKCFFSLICPTSPIAINSLSLLITPAAILFAHACTSAHFLDKVASIAHTLSSSLASVQISNGKIDMCLCSSARATALPPFQMIMKQTAHQGNKEKQQHVYPYPCKDLSPFRPRHFSAYQISPTNPHQNTPGPISPLTHPSPTSHLPSKITPIQNPPSGPDFFDASMDCSPLRLITNPEFLSDPNPNTRNTSPTDHINISTTSHTFPQFQTSLLSETVAQSSSLSSLPSPQKPKLQDKANKAPIRRSQRLQAKKSSNYSVGTQTKKRKGKKAAPTIPFSLHSHESPLQVDTALLILQATGLQIDQEMENMIQQAVIQDKATDSTENTRPPTPLHDVVPPRIMPEDGSVL